MNQETQLATAAPSPGITTAPEIVPETQESIAQIAHRYWEARGRPVGSPEDDWFRAEHSLQSITQLAYLNWQARGCPVGSPEDDCFRAVHDLQIASLGANVSS